MVIATRRAVDVDVRGVAQRSGSRSEEQRREQSLDQPAAGLASGAVRHLDLRIAKPDLGAGWSSRALATHAIDVRLVAIAAFRCS